MPMCLIGLAGDLPKKYRVYGLYLHVLGGCTKVRAAWKFSAKIRHVEDCIFISRDAVLRVPAHPSKARCILKA